VKMLGAFLDGWGFSKVLATMYKLWIVGSLGYGSEGYMRVHLQSALATCFCGGGVVTRRHDKIEFSKSALLEAAGIGEMKARSYCSSLLN